MDLTYVIETGPHTELAITGIDVPDTIRRELIAAWVDVPVDGLLREEFDDAPAAVAGRAGLPAAGDRPGDRDGGPARRRPKTATLTIAPGAKSTERVVVYTGNEGLTDADLDKALKTAGATERVWTSPGDASAVVLAAYRRNGYLSAQATVGDVRIDGARAELPIRIEEGPQFRAGTVRIDGVGEVADVDLTPPVEETRCSPIAWSPTPCASSNGSSAAPAIAARA